MRRPTGNRAALGMPHEGQHLATGVASTHTQFRNSPLPKPIPMLFDGLSGNSSTGGREVSVMLNE